MNIGEPRRRCGGLFIFLLIACCFELASLQPIIPNETFSSPSSIITTKDSAVWLHWNYTFNGDGFFVIAKQQWMVNDTALNTVTVIAEKFGLNGQITVANSLPRSLAGRIIAFPLNNALCIRNLQYNDSKWKFESTAFIEITSIMISMPFVLAPTIHLNVIGECPAYLSSPSRNIEVTENGLLSVVTRFDGNPKPTAEAQWSESSAKQAMTVTDEYPFVYKAEYSAGHINSKFCGKTLTLRAQNSVGKATDIDIAVTVILSLNDPSLRAGKPNQSCVEVQWEKRESGLCNVTYTVNFKDQSGSVQYTNTEINKSGTTICGIPSNLNITNVEMQMSSTKKSATFTADVSEKPIPPPTLGTISSPSTTTATTETTTATQNPLIPKTSKVGAQVCSNTALHVGYSVVIIILTSVIVFHLAEKFRRKKRKNEVIENKSAVGNPKAASNSTIEMHYMELDRHQTAKESNYATLSNSPYETPKDVTYANVAKF